MRKEHAHMICVPLWMLVACALEPIGSDDLLIKAAWVLSICHSLLWIMHSSKQRKFQAWRTKMLKRNLGID